MRYLKKFWESNEYTSLEETLREYNLRLDHILPDGSVDVTGNLEFSGRYNTFRHIKPEKLPFRINHLEGHFTCVRRMDISTLESTPRSISGNFEIKNCGITDLRGGPERVGGLYWIKDPITSLEGSPIEVRQSFMITNGKMTNLVGSPQFVGYQYTIVNCQDLTSLEGITQNVGKRVHIENCPNLWDAAPLRNVDVEFIDLYMTPLHELVRIFGSPKNFKDSLDYNYIKFDRVEGCVINLFKFKEALHEFDIDYMNSFVGKPEFSEEGFGCWKFVDEDGRLCKFN